MNEGNVLISLTHKRQEFAHERELRAVVQVPAEDGKPLVCMGLHVPVDLNRLVDVVCLAPLTRPEIHDRVKVLMTRTGLSKSLVRSNLDDPPVY